MAVLRTAWSVAWYGWRAVHNRSFRFSRMKSALIWQGLQVGFLLFVARQMRPLPPGTGFEGLLVLMALQMGWFGLLFGFSRGQFQLFQGLLVPLFQITPARPLAFFVGRAVEHLPVRLWSTLLWAWAYSAAVPGPGRWGALAALAGVGALVGLLANLAGLLLVALWARYSSRTLRNGSLFFSLLTLAGATWAIIYLSGGGSLTALALQMRELRTTLAGLVALVGGLPGLAMLTALALRPAWVEDLYRTGLHQILELGEQAESRRGRSRWLPLPDGALRGIVAKEWIGWSRSRITRIQGVIWLFGTVGVVVAGRAVAGEPLPAVVGNVGALSLLAWGVAYSHWVVRVFEAERAGIWLYRLTAVPAATLLGSKFLAIFLPSALLVALSTLTGSLVAGLEAPRALAVLGWTLTALAAGTVGGFGAAAATAGEEPPEPEHGPRPDEAAPPQGGNVNGWYVLARMMGLVAPMALIVWTGSGQPGLPVRLPVPFLLAASGLLPLGVLAFGYRLMTRSWDAGEAP